MGPWNLFELDKFTEKKLKGMVDMLPALPPMNYDNLNRRIGELDDYPLEIPVAIIAIVLVVSTVFLVATLVVYAYIIFRLRKSIQNIISYGKNINRTSHWIRSTRNKENVTHPSRNPGWTTLPTTTSLETNQTRNNTCRDYISPDISSTGTPVVVKDKIELLTTPKQIKRYEKYLVKQKEKLQEDTKL